MLLRHSVDLRVVSAVRRRREAQRADAVEVRPAAATAAAGAELAPLFQSISIPSKALRCLAASRERAWRGRPAVARREAMRDASGGVVLEADGGSALQASSGAARGTGSAGGLRQRGTMRDACGVMALTAQWGRPARGAVRRRCDGAALEGCRVGLSDFRRRRSRPARAGPMAACARRRVKPTRTRGGRTKKTNC
jgi:hypothetical protein